MRGLSPALCNDAQGLLSTHLNGSARLHFGSFLVALHLLGIGISSPSAAPTMGSAIPSSYGESASFHLHQSTGTSSSQYWLLVSPAFAIEVFSSFGNGSILQRRAVCRSGDYGAATPLQRALSKASPTTTINPPAPPSSSAPPRDKNNTTTTPTVCMSPSDVISGLSECSITLLGGGSSPTIVDTTTTRDALVEVSRYLGDTCYLSTPIGGGQQQQQGGDCEGCRGLLDGMTLFYTTHHCIMGGVLDELDGAMDEKERESTRKSEGGKKGGKSKSKNSGAVSSTPPPLRRFNVDSGVSTVDVLKQAHSLVKGPPTNTTTYSPPWWLTTGWWCRAFFPAPLGVTGPTRNTNNFNSCCLCPTSNNKDRHTPSLLASEFEQAIYIILGACSSTTTTTAHTPSSSLEYVPRCELNGGYHNQQHHGGMEGSYFSSRFAEISSLIADPLEPMENKVGVLGQQLLGHLDSQHTRVK
eukprot:TRINITY_DN4101_c0_g1_i3.p1 TRINITY_DN4101_c0_g1~~TRINITY_DN4101_c0_g1_i3.p1  ORF type:complete len:469 (+),score=75.35 TRINITY_DN4101_c0_g1_i3:213-1619(+)